MCEFLQGDDLSQKIREVVAGQDAHCAVAFWGCDAVTELFGTDQLQRPDVQVICDLSLGGTNPDTLRALGAPDNPNVRYRDGLHAKVFLSARGAVVGSANASNNGIGFMGRNAQLLEAGTYFPPASDSWHSISDWLTALSEHRSARVDRVALEVADLAWNSRHEGGRGHDAGNQPDFLNYDPALHGLVLVCWYEGPGDQAMDDPRFADNGRSYMYFSDARDEIMGHWICAFMVSNNAAEMPRDNNAYFFLVTDFVYNAANDDAYEPNLAFQHTNANARELPFSFDSETFNDAFREVVNDSQGRYAPLRREVEDDNEVWLTQDRVDLMRHFWRDVQDNYRNRLSDD